MKIVLLIFLSFTSNIAFAQSNWQINEYNGILLENKRSIFEDNFENNANDWKIQEQGKYTSYIDNGIYQISTPDRTKSFFKEVDFPMNCDFEIEIIALLKSQTGINEYGNLKMKNDCACGIIWGRHSYDKNQFSFNYNLAKQIQISKRSSASNFKFYIKKKEIENIDITTYNKLTIRKIEQKYFFFVNEILVHTMSTEPFFGNRIGFAVSNANLEIDYFKISEISKDKNFKTVVSKMPIIETSPIVQKDINPTIIKNSIDNEKEIISDIDTAIPHVIREYPYRFALVIGNEDYSSQQSNLAPEVNVDFAERDANTFKEYALKVLNIPQTNLIYEINADAVSMQRAIKKLQLLIKNTNGKAEVFFYYAGHGFPDEKTKEAYLIPVNVSGSDLEYAIKLKDIYERLTEHPSKRITVFLDACFSGGARNQGLIAARGVKIKPKNNILNGNIIVFSASSGEQSALPYKEKYHGLFTYYLLKKIKETKGEINYYELYQYINEKVSLNSILKNNKEQNPTVNVSSDAQNNWKEWKIID